MNYSQFTVYYMSKEQSSIKKKTQFADVKCIGIQKATSTLTIVRSNSKQTKGNKQNIILPNLRIKNMENRRTENASSHQKTIKMNKKYISLKEKTKLCLTQNVLPRKNKSQLTQIDNLIKMKTQVLFTTLINNKIIEQQKVSYLINRDVFVLLLLKLLNYRITDNNKFQVPQLQFLNSDLDHMLDLIKQKNNCKNNLTLQNAIININVTCSDQSKQRERTHNSQLAVICSKINQKKENMELSEGKMKFLSYQVEELQSKIKSKGQESHQYQAKIEDLKKEMEKTKLESQQIKSRLEKVAIQQRELMNFAINQNKNKIVKMAGEDYKEIESEIYQYAVYLQSNELASSLTYQHLPIVCHTFEIQNEIRNVNATIIQNDALSIDEKSKIMRNFVLQISNKYKKKDEELQKLLIFKTQCIKSFVQKMQKWLNNWEYKQEYLKNLRVEFVQNNEKILASIKELTSMNFSQSAQSEAVKKCQQISKLYLQIQMNYEMGNFFY